MRTVPILITALLAAALIPAANAHLIRADNWIDDFAVKQDGSLRGAIRALGPPGRVVLTSDITCRAGLATAASATPSRAARDGTPGGG